MKEIVKRGEIIDIKLNYENIVLTDSQHRKFYIEPIEFLKSINDFDLEIEKKRTRTWAIIKF